MVKFKKTVFSYFVFLTLLSYVACTTPAKKKYDSEWTELNRAGAISCSPWPLKQSELDISQMIAASEGVGAFVASIRQRTGAVLPALAETNGSDVVEVDALKYFPIGRDAYVVATSFLGQEPIAFVIQNKNQRAWLEVRAMRDNRLVSRMSASLNDEVLSGKLFAAKVGWWLQLNHSDNLASFVYVNPEKPSSWKFVISQYQSSTRFAHLVANSKVKDAYVVEASKGTESSRSAFLVTKLDPTSKFSANGEFPLTTKGGVESWSASFLNNQIALSVVRGDSMIGQASLIVTAFSTSVPLKSAWNKEFSYADVHLGEPVWLSNGEQALIGLMRWVDGEGALGRIRVDGEGARQLTDVGVFAKGSVLAAGYLNKNQRGLGAFRYRDQDLWKYKLCRLSI